MEQPIKTKHYQFKFGQGWYSDDNGETWRQMMGPGPYCQIVPRPRTGLTVKEIDYENKEIILEQAYDS